MANLSLEDVDVNMDQMRDLNDLQRELLEDLLDYQIELSRAKNEDERALIKSTMLHELMLNLSKMATLNSILNDYLQDNQKALQGIINKQYNS